MIDRKALWSPTGGLYAIAAGLVILAMATGNSIFSHRYQFAPYPGGGEVVWRGDMVTGRAVLCATERILDEQKERGLNYFTRC